MRILVACEESGTVRDAFLAKGHDAWSCDLVPSRKPGPHFIMDAVECAYRSEWDVMIAHPPCTYLANSGAKHLYVEMKKENGKDACRWFLLRQAALMFKQLLEAPIERVAVENPIMLGHAKKIIGTDCSQVIQPWQFGHGETKATCLWLKNLPKLTPTNIVDGREARVHKMAPGPNRARDRSVTYQGIASAMAEQWGILK